MSASSLPHIPSDQLYRLTETAVAMMHGQSLKPSGLRLLHALIHHTLRRSDTWFDPETQQPEEGYRAQCTDLRAVLGIDGSKCNRALAAGLAELAVGGLFETIGFLHKHTWLAWRFTETAFAALFYGIRYGRCDARHVQDLRTQADLVLHAELAVIRRMRKPETTFDVSVLARILHSRKQTWEGISRQVLPALARIITRDGPLAVLLLDAEGWLPGIDTLHLRLWYRGNIWSQAQFGKVNETTREILLLKDEAWLRLKPHELPDAVTTVRTSARFSS